MIFNPFTPKKISKLQLKASFFSLKTIIAVIANKMEIEKGTSFLLLHVRL